MRSQVLARALLGLAGAGSGVLFLLGWRASERALHPAPGELPWELGDYPELTPERLIVDSRTGVSLNGRFFKGRLSATVVLTHGYGGNQDEMLPVASALHRAGLSVFTYDSRGCGGSGGEVTFGAREQDDLRSVIDAVAARSDVDPKRIGTLGFSMGAATTVLEAAGDARVKAVVDDSGWAEVMHWLRPQLTDPILQPTRAFSPLALKLAELRTGISLGRLRPVDAAGRLGPRPILMIHGSADEVVPPADAELMFAASGDRCELWRVEGAAHGDTLRPGGATTSPRVGAFLKRALGPEKQCKQAPLAARE